MSQDVTGRDRLRPWRRTRRDQDIAELRQRVDDLTDNVAHLAVALRERRPVERSEGDEIAAAVNALSKRVYDDLAGLDRRIADLEQRVEQLAAAPAPAVLDIPPAATFDGEQHHDEPAAEPDPEPAAPVLTEKQQALVAAVTEFVRENEWVPLTDAIQAVRDTEARVRADCAATYLLDGVAEARREAFREAVEALRELAETESGEAATALRGAALLLAARLSPDNPEGNA